MIVLIDETHGRVNERLEVWRQTLESKGLDLAGRRRSTWSASLVT